MSCNKKKRCAEKGGSKMFQICLLFWCSLLFVNLIKVMRYKKGSPLFWSTDIVVTAVWRRGRITKSAQRPFGRFVSYKILDFKPCVLTRQLAKKCERLQGIVINYRRRVRRARACLGVAGKAAHKTRRLCYPLYPRQLPLFGWQNARAAFIFMKTRKALTWLTLS